MNTRQYQLIESYLLFRMLKARKEHRNAVRTLDPAGFEPIEYCGAAGAARMTLASEAAYRAALHRFYDFVLTKTVPEDLEGVDLSRRRVLDDLKALESGLEESGTPADATDSGVEAIAAQMIGSFLGAQPVPDRRVASIDRREEVRIDAQESPALLSDEEQYRIPIHLLNISKTGLGISSQTPLPAGRIVLIELDDEFKVFGKVRYCRTEEKMKRYSIGIKIFKVRTGRGSEI